MAYPTTIKLFLAKGQPDGLRTAEISNWSGLAIAGPRSELSELRARLELKSPGVYFLIGVDENTGDQKSILVRQIMFRIDSAISLTKTESFGPRLLVLSVKTIT